MIFRSSTSQRQTIFQTHKLELSDDVLSMLTNGLCPMNYGKEKEFFQT